MDTPSPFDVDLGRMLERLRQAHRHRRPDYRQRMDDLARLADTVKRHADELVRAVSGDFGRRSRHVTQSADLMTTLG
ncbi:MAG TPA: coniferyl aldehyde dehydrogenase, partial [Arenimonas sp.]|nr:coniferyl aldehyde dehydrogenase [Arenimonas sp.]